MAHIRSYKHPTPRKTPLALALAASTAMSPVSVLADTATLPEVTVNATADVPYKADRSANSKFTQPLVDTPQTLQIVKKEVLQDQGAASLMDALRNTPGISMNFGEQGSSAAGDNFYMRGFSTQSAIFVDGIRDLGAITRDVFNLEQIEIAKGPAGSDIGRGSQSGYINLISKLPQATDANSATVGIGTYNYQRATADINQKVGDGVAVRINVMEQDSDVAKRDHVHNKSVAIAPSIAFGLNSPTRLYLYTQHVRQDNVPDGGIAPVGMDYYYNAGTSGAFWNGKAKADRNTFYGNKNDYEKVAADMFTAKFEQDYSDKTRLTNTTRYGQTSMDRRMTGLGSQGSSTGTVTPTTWTLSRQGTDQNNEILANQTNLVTEFMTGQYSHALSTGVEVMYERQRTNSIASSTISNVNFYAPAVYDANYAPLVKNGNSYGSTFTTALYAFDTMKLSEAWSVNAGLRADRYRTSTSTGNMEGGGNLYSYKVGALYKPAANGSIYTAFAHSLTPPGGDSFALSATATNQSSPSMDPQETDNSEIGTKWELLDKRLLLTAALYRTDNSNQVTFDSSTNTYFQSGKTRVEGIELSATGQLTSNWQVMAGVSRMRTQVLNVNSNTSVATTGVMWSPDLTATLWTTYTQGDYTVGGGVRYVSEQNAVVTSAALGASDRINGTVSALPSYSVVDLMAGYKASKNVNLRLNVYNVLDREYVASVNKNSNRITYGLPLTAMLSATLNF